MVKVVAAINLLRVTFERARKGSTRSIIPRSPLIPRRRRRGGTRDRSKSRRFEKRSAINRGKRGNFLRRQTVDRRVFVVIPKTTTFDRSSRSFARGSIRLSIDRERSKCRQVFARNARECERRYPKQRVFLDSMHAIDSLLPRFYANSRIRRIETVTRNGIEGRRQTTTSKGS